MILKVFKEKSNKKCLNKMLLNRDVIVNDSKIKSLGIIIHVDEIDDFELFRGLYKELKILPNNLKVIAYSSSNKDKLSSWDTCFNNKDFGWNGTIKNVELKTFLDTKFHALISYYANDVLELKLLTVLSQAPFKIGILQTDNRINDLIIKTNSNEFSVFKHELVKYLTILKKIKNE
ncbi:MAG: hypothetical protein K9I95_04885 [Flavobacteriaceae bacterium]|jgi:hypothetical protein|nr:hypothetical protein [Flavobacteriaceae bacterium]